MSEPISPICNGLSAPFWGAAQNGCLVLPWCIRTERHFWPPSPVSPFTSAGAVEWREADTHGILIGVAVFRRTFQKAFAERIPYGVGLVELTAGPRLQVHIPNPDAGSAPKTGDRVTIVFASIVTGGPLVPAAVSFAHQDIQRGIG
jgi:uncharacterized OB-fold protein